MIQSRSVRSHSMIELSSRRESIESAMSFLERA
jgi:hypothetical protein